MQWYYVYCERDGVEHRHWGRMSQESSDILHDHLDRTSRVCQVVPVSKKQVPLSVSEI